ncbi:hypothetical protein [Pseudomonas akapageensis]|uniref:hypothetical protein n=1 Tax=Pseudomonas akapageensis TaxID=2609961 RepID=UPI001408E33C|nr:hypothetical protein [Pseudomonas akapageensis]
MTVTPLRADAWAHGNPHSQVRYRLVAEAEASSLCCVLNLFAMQYLTPHKIIVLQEDGQLLIDIELGDLSWHRAEVIAQKMRNLINVCEVTLELAEREPMHAVG